MEDVKITIDLDGNQAEKGLQRLQASSEQAEKSFRQARKGVLSLDEALAEETKRLDQEKASLDGSSASMRKKETATRDSESATKKHTEALKQHTDAEKESSKATEGTSSSMKDLMSSAKSLPGPIGAVASALSNLVGVAGKFIGMPILAFLGALAGAYEYVTWSMRRTVEGQEELDVKMSKFHQRMENVKDMASYVGRALFSMFDTATTAAGNLLGKVEGIYEYVRSLGGGAVGKVVDRIVPNWMKVGGAVGRWAWNRNTDDAASLQDRENKLWKERVAFMTEEAELEKRISELRAKAYEHSSSSAEKEAATKAAIEATNKLYDQKIKLAKEEASIAKERLKLSDTDKTAQEAAAQAEAAAIALETQRANALRMLNRMDSRFQNATEKDAAKAAKELLKQTDKLYEQQLAQDAAQARQRLDALNAQEEARIAAIEDAGERERAEQEHQHQLRLQQIRQQEEAYRKANYEEAKKTYEAKNPGKKYSQTSAGRNGYAGASLTADQSAKIEADLKKENAVYARMLKERYDGELATLREYVKEYGSIQAQRAALTEEYDAKIAKESDATRKAMLEHQRDDALQALNMEEIRKDINWEVVFHDLDKVSTDYLRDLREKLQAALDMGDITAKDAEVLSERILEIEDKISERTNVWSSLIPALKERERLTRAAVKAEEAYNREKSKQVEMLTKQASIQNDLISKIKTATGKDVTAQELSQMNRDDYVKALGLDPLSKAADKARNEFDRLTAANIDLTKSTQDVSAAQKLLENQQNIVKGFKGGFDAIMNSAVEAAGGGVMGYVNVINDNIQSMSDFVDNLGLGETEFGVAVHDFADGANSFQGAIQSLAKGDIFGAINGVFNGFKSWAGIFGSKDNTAKMQKQIEKLNLHSEALAAAMGSLEEAFERSSVADSQQISKDMQELMRSMEKDAAAAMYKEAEKHGAIRSSLNSSVEDNKGWIAAMKEVSSILGRVVKSSKDFLSLTADEMAAIRDWDNGGLLGRILEQYRSEGGTGGRSEQLPSMILDYLNKFAGKFEEIETQATEKLTSVSFDTIVNDFASAINDMDSTSEAFSENFSSYLQNAVLQTQVTDLFKGRLEEWYQMLSSYMGDDHTLDEREVAHLQAMWDGITTDANKARDALSRLWTDQSDFKDYFDGLSDSVKSALLDSEGGVEAWTENIKKMMAEALIEQNVFSDPKYTEWVEDLQKRMNDIMNSQMTHAEQEQALSQLRESSADGYKRWAEVVQQCNEAVGLSIEETDESFTELFDNLIDAITDADKSVEDWSRDFRKKLVRQIVEATLFTDEDRAAIDTANARISTMIKDGLSLTDMQQELDVLEGYITKGKAAYEQLAEAWHINEVEEQKVETSFSDMRDAVLSSLTDIENGAKDFEAKMNELLLGDILDKFVLGNEVEVWEGNIAHVFDNFDAWLTDWEARYSAAMDASYESEEAREAALQALVDESIQVRESEAAAAESVVERLKQSTEELGDSTFKDMADEWKSALMDMEGTTEAFAENIKKMMAGKVIDALLETNGLTSYLDTIQGQVNAIFGGDGSLETKMSELEPVIADMVARYEQLAPFGEQIREWFGLTPEAENPFEGLKGSLVSALMDTESTAKDFGKQIGATLAQEMIDSIVSEKYGEQIESLSNALRAAIVTGDADEITAARRALEQLYAEARKDVEAIVATQKELEVEELSTPFSNMRDTMLSSLADMEDGMESFVGSMNKLLVNDMLEKFVLNSPLTLASGTYEDFDTWLGDWERRYDEAMKMSYDTEEARQEAIQSLIDETIEARQQEAEAAAQYTERLKESVEEVADTTLKDLSGEWTSTLMDMDATAEDWAETIGRTIAEKIINEMVVANMAQPLLDNLQAAFNDAMSGGATWTDVIGSEQMQRSIDAIKAKYPELKAVSDEILAAFGITKKGETDEEQHPFEGLQDSLVSSLMDMESTAEQFGKDIGRTLAQKMIESILTEEYGERISTLADELRDAIETGDANQIALARQALENIYAEAEARVSTIRETQRELEEVNDTTFTDMRDSFLTALMDMTAGTEDWAKNITRIMTEQLVDRIVLGDKFDDYLEGIQRQYDGIMADDSLTAEQKGAELAKIGQGVNAFAKELQGLTESIFSATGWNTFTENVTTPIDNLRSTFVSALMDMTNKTEDFANDIGKILTEAFIDKFVLGDAFDQQLEHWQQEYSKIMGGDLSEEERAKQLKDLRNSIATAKEEYAREANAIHELMGEVTYADQTATMNLSDKATYEQMDQYLGTQMATLIATEQGNDVRLQILATLQQMSGLTSPNSSVVAEIRGLVSIGNEYLLDIKRSNREMLTQFGQRLSSIDSKLNRVL